MDDELREIINDMTEEELCEFIADLKRLEKDGFISYYLDSSLRRSLPFSGNWDHVWN